MTTCKKVAIHYYGRLAAKQGWRFDSTYDHKDDSGDSIPFVFVLGSNNVIAMLCIKQDIWSYFVLPLDFEL